MTPAGDDETLDDEEPQLDTVMIQHPGAVNRIRVSIPYMDIYTKQSIHPLAISPLRWLPSQSIG